MTVLQLTNVSKRYDSQRWALHHLTLRQEEGVLGVVGPNGAGKTTLLRLLATLLVPTEGTLVWNQWDIAQQALAVRRELGFLPQEFGVYPYLTAEEFLRYLGTLKGLSPKRLPQRVDAVLAMVHLQTDRHRRLQTFSGGMIRRLGIAQALLNEPRLLVLDEPTVGLDPAERVAFRQLISSLAGDRIIILSTHIMSDVEAMASDLALIQAGQLWWAGSPAGLLADAEGVVWSLTVPAQELAALQQTARLSTTMAHGATVDVRIIAHERPHPHAVPIPPTLEEAYLVCLETLHGDETNDRHR